MKVRRIDRAVYHNSGYGPTFGSHDIYIADGAGGNTGSSANLGDDYVWPFGYRYGTSSIRSLLAGSYSFQPDDLEVFYQRSS